MTTRRFTRRDLLHTGAAGTLAATVTPRLSVADGAGVRPNILWLVSEDTDRFIGAYGDTLAHTPVIDRLARRGLLYRQAYANAPICAVSRFGILTGVYPQSCGAAQNHRTRIAHPAGLIGYPGYLRRAGYYCINNAKTDYNSTIDPLTIWDACSAQAHWRNRPAGTPFMAVFNYETTHSSSIFETTEGRVKPADVRVPSYLPDTPAVRRDVASYYNKIEIMDRQLGERLAELEADGLADDTIIFYYSDHGGVLPRSKQFCYEEGLHVPLIVVIPRKYAHLAPAPMGSALDTMVSHIDLAPTVLALAGVAQPAEMVGRAFLGTNVQQEERYVFGGRNRIDERIDFTRTLTDGRYRYLRNYLPHRPWGLHDGYLWQARSWQDWERHYRTDGLNAIQARFFGPRPYEELYDLRDDPDEIRNLVNEPGQQAKLQELRNALDRYLVSINDNGFIPEGSSLGGYENSRAPGAYPLQKIMGLAQAAASRDAGQLETFRAGLLDDNEAVRYWCAQGLLLLGRQASSARGALLRTLSDDPCAQVRIVAAEALAALGDAPLAISSLTSLLDMNPLLSIKLYVLNALNGLVDNPSFKTALPSLKRWAALALKDVELNWDYWTVRSLARYLIALSDGTYQPGYITYTMDKLSASQRKLLRSRGT